MFWVDVMVSHTFTENEAKLHETTAVHKFDIKHFCVAQVPLPVSVLLRDDREERPPPEELSFQYLSGSAVCIT